MKKLSFLLAIIMIVGLFSSCEGIGDGSKNNIFDFWYEIEKTEYMRGEEIRINAYVKNISGRTQKYMGCSGNDYIPLPELYWLTDDGEVGGELIYEPLVFPCDVKEKKIKRNAIGCQTYVFVIPDDAVCGAYSLKLSRGEDSRVFENVLRITDTPQYEFSYEIEKTEFLRGEEFSITATVTNSARQQKDVYCFFPSIELYWLTDKGDVGGKLEHNLLPAFEPLPETIEIGESGSYTYSFLIPNDAVCAEYTLELSRGAESRVFENILRITDLTSQNENNEYNYSPITVSSGGKSINPIRVGTSTQIQYADGGFAIGCDGMGVWRYFGEKDTDLSTFPLLVLEDEPKLTLAENTRLDGVCVYGMDAKEIGGYYSSLKALEAFPAGEYVVVIKVVYDTSSLSQTEYEITNYDDFFRLSIPQNTACKEYDYSPVRISCGGVDVIPIRALLYSSYQSGDQAIEADGLGAAGLFEDKSFSPDDLPALTFTTNVNSYCPAGVTIGKAKVYDLDYNQIDLNMEYMWNFSKLPAGEYIVAFDEKEVGENSTYGYESLFRLIIPESKFKSFSYGAVCQTYKPGDPGVKTEGFKNTSEQSVTTTEEAAERAKNECTIEYDTITVLYDANEKTWSVTFSIAATPGGCQTVYLNNKGITRLIVYGE